MRREGGKVTVRNDRPREATESRADEARLPSKSPSYTRHDAIVVLDGIVRRGPAVEAFVNAHVPEEILEEFEFES